MYHDVTTTREVPVRPARPPRDAGRAAWRDYDRARREFRRAVTAIARGDR